MRRQEHAKERRFLSLAARVKATDQERSEFERIIGEDLDWEDLFSRSRDEGIAPFIHHHIRKLPAYTSLPENVKEWARQAYFQNLARNTNLAAAIQGISAALGAAGIGTLALKGIHLAGHIYKDMGLRPVGDIDLLIRKSDLVAVNGILTSLGYREPPNVKEMAALNGITPFNSLVYTKEGAGYFVHLHWHLINSTWPLEFYVGKMEMDGIWAGSQAVSIDGTAVRALSPEHELIYLVNHGFHHYFGKLIVCADVREALITLGPRIDPGRVRAEAVRFGMEGVLREGLRVVAGALSCDICRAASSWFGPGAADDNARERGHRRARRYCRSYAVYFKGIKGTGHKIRFLRGTFFPKRTTLANSAGVPIASIKTEDYLKRIAGSLQALFG